MTNPKNVIIAENCFSQGYIRGSSVKFFEYGGRGQNPRYYNPNTGEHEADLIAVMVPYGSAESCPNPMNILSTKPWQPNMSGHRRPFDGKDRHAPFYGADVISRLFGLHEYARNRDDPATEPFRTYEKTQNSVVYRGHSFTYDPTTCQHTAVTINTGHWGKNVYPGVARVRNGDIKYMERQDFKPTVSIARS